MKSIFNVFLVNRLIYLSLFLTVATTSFCQKENFRFSRFNVDNGLSQSLVYSIAQDGLGFMWFGTKDGLNRFDGYIFTHYHYNPFDSTTISDNSVSALFCDSKKRLWVGTMNGSLDLYDPERDVFLHFLKENANKGSINSIIEDLSGHIWIATYGNGLFELIIDDSPAGYPHSVVKHYTSRPGDTNRINDNFVLGIFPDEEGFLWVSTTTGLFQYAQLGQPTLKFSTPDCPIFQAAQKKGNSGEVQFDFSELTRMERRPSDFGGGIFTEDGQGRIWIGTPGGMLLLNSKRDTMYFLNPVRLPEVENGGILSILNVKNTNSEKIGHSLWLGFYNSLGILNTQDFTLHFVSNDPGYAESLIPGAILSIFQDRSGCVWLGSSGMGLSKFSTRSTLFPLPEFRTADGKMRIAGMSTRSFFDTPEYLLIGNNNEFMMADKRTKLMRKEDYSSNGIPYGLVYSIIGAEPGSCWIGANSGLFKFDLQSRKSINYIPDISENGNIDNRIFKLYNDGKGTVWCLTPYGLSAFNIAKKLFTNYFYGHKPVNGYSEPTYGDIYPDQEGNLWLGTGDGLFYFDTATNQFTSYTFNDKDTASLSFNAVRCLLPDPSYPQKYLWVGTAGGGLNKFDLKTKKFRHITVDDGLPNNVIYGVLSDDRGYLWMSTNNGISRFDPVEETFTNFGTPSGLQSNEFNSGAFYKNKHGEMFFGGINGFNSFYPDKIVFNTHVPDVVFTDFRLGGQTVSIHDKDSPLRKPIFETKEINLSYEENNLSFEIAGLDFTNPEKIQYAYKLEPVNSHWIQMGTNRVIFFSNLSPGKYTLYVRAANTDGSWGEESAYMKLVITPPWWKTWWAYLSYALFLFAVLFFLRKYELSRVWLKNRLKVEHIESEKLRELDFSKSRFFANISHEFRTPLTLIIGPVEDLLQKKEARKFKTDLSYIRRNAKRLLQLINQLLDLSKLDARNYSINTSREDIIPFIKQIVHSFSSMAHLKNIELEVEVDPRLKNMLRDEEAMFYFDDDIIEKVLFNLLSNSFKFTNNGGHITVVLGLPEIEEGFLELRVEDDGVGISPDKLPHVFERFYQAADTERGPFDGSGIGLSLVKELIELHGGKITPMSRPGELTVFSCLLPLNKKVSTLSVNKEPLQNNTAPVYNPEESKEAGQSLLNKHLPVILLVEDQPDVRRYIHDRLENDFQVIEAKDGEEALVIAKEQIPDMVISDVMMPRMDGIEFCHLLKTDIITSHIPVILLTARAADADKLAGLETGADAYLIKPFNARELLIRVHNLINLRNTLRKKFSGKLIVKPKEITVSSQDSRFMERLLGTIENHISDDKFSVEQLSNEFAMSPSQINRKLKAIINKSAQQLIRSVRMERAMELLKNDQAGIAEIAYETGFSEPAYFSRVFKLYFGYPPSEVNKRNETPES